MIALAGLVAATLLCLAVAAVLIGTREGQPALYRTRLAAWCSGWLLIGAALALASGMRRAGGQGLRKLAGRIRAIRPAPETAPAPERPLPAKPYMPRHGRPRRVATAR